MKNCMLGFYGGNIVNHIFFAVFCMVAAKGMAQPILALTPVISSGLYAPLQVVNAGDGTNRVFIVQQGGSVLVYNAAFANPTTFVTVSNVQFSGERGLLSMVFHPNYATNGLFYVYYTNTQGNLELARYKVSSDPAVADANSKVVLITIPHPTNTNHNGGELHFGADGFLYLTTGDGGGAGDVPNNAQNTTVLLGKMLRFNVTTNNVAPYYTIPPGNVFGNEIFHLGLRNPYRWSFDRLTNDMWIGDVGQDRFEEIDYLPANTTGGQNFGWRCYEGNSTYNTSSGCVAASNYVFPVYTYPTANPSGAVTGGVVYRGSAYPTLQGYDISADVYTGDYFLTKANGTGGFTTNVQNLPTKGIVNFGETEDGEVYAVSIFSNTVFRVGTSGVLPVTLLKFSAIPTTTGTDISWQTSFEHNAKGYSVEYSLDGNNYISAADIPAKNLATGAMYNYEQVINYTGVMYYRLKMFDLDGKSNYSNIIKLVLNTNNKNIIIPTLITNRILNVNISTPNYTSLQLINMAGVVMLKQNISGQTGNINLPLGTIAAGIYIVQLTGNSTSINQKIFIDN